MQYMELLKDLLKMEYEKKKESGCYYKKLIDIFKFKELGFSDVREQLFKNDGFWKKELNVDNVDIVLGTLADSNDGDAGGVQTLIILEYKKTISNEFDARILCNDTLFLPRNVTYDREKVSDMIDYLINYCSFDMKEMSMKSDEFRGRIKSFKEDRGENAGLWLHRNGSGIGQILNYYFLFCCYCKIKTWNPNIFVGLTNSIKWVFFNYSLNEIAGIFKEGFSEETIKSDKINFFDISDYEELEKAIRSLANGKFPKRDESKKKIILIEIE